MGASAVGRPNRRVCDGHHIIHGQQNITHEQQNLLFWELLKFAVEVQGIKSCGVYGNSGLLDSVDDQLYLLYEGPADFTTPRVY